MTKFLNVCVVVPIKLILLFPVVIVCLIVYLAGYNDTATNFLLNFMEYKL